MRISQEKDIHLRTHILGWIIHLQKAVSIPFTERPAVATSLSLPSELDAAGVNIAFLYWRRVKLNINGREREDPPSTEGLHNGDSLPHTTTVSPST